MNGNSNFNRGSFNSGSSFGNSGGGGGGRGSFGSGGNFIGGGNFNGLKEAFNKAYRQFLNVPVPMTEEQQLMQSISKAHAECQMAENRFNQATDPDLIDQAIYDMMAAKTKYAYLLKSAKEMNLHL